MLTGPSPPALLPPHVDEFAAVETMDVVARDRDAKAEDEAVVVSPSWADVNGVVAVAPAWREPARAVRGT